MARIALTHRIVYRFAQPVRLSTHWLRLRPAPHCREGTSSYSLKVDGGRHFINTVRDSYGNYLLRLDMPGPVTELSIAVELIADLTPYNPFDFLLEPSAALFPFAYDRQLQRELHAYLSNGETPEAVKVWCEQLDKEPMPTTAYLSGINQRIFKALTILRKSRSEHLHTGRGGNLKPDIRLAEDPCTALALDPAGFLVEVLRALGMAARFTSGFSVLLDDIRDSATLHVWIEVYLPGAGWVGLDPARGVFTAETCIPLASAPDLLRVQPVVGYHEACELNYMETTTLERLTPLPRVYPYSPMRLSG
jgi:transglutaminase-like putative cysteine protease